MLVAAWLVLLLVAAPAGAHAVLEDMSPDSDEQLAEPPEQVRLSFSENVTAAAGAVRLFDPAAGELDVGEVRVDGTELVAELPDLDTDGSYTVAWRVVSADGHPIQGAYLFHLREATLMEPVEAGAPSSSLAADLYRAIGAVLAIGGLIVCAGSVMAESHPPLPKWWGLRWVPVLAGTALMLGGSVVAVGSTLSESFEVALSTVSGRGAAVAVLLAVAGLVGSVLPVGRRLELLLVAAVAVTVALQGHAVAVAPVALSAPATLLHVVAAVVWLAGLFRLEHLSRVAPAPLAGEVRRFTSIGLVAVVILAATGAVLLLDRVALDELTSTTYGRLGLAKTAALLGAVALAWRNRAAGQRLAAQEPTASESVEPAALTSAVRAVRTGVRVEMVVLAVALGLGAALAQVPPPGEGGDGVTGGFFVERAEFGDGVVEVTFDPGERGMNEVHATALGPDGRLMVDAGEIQLSLELPEEDVGPIEPDMQIITQGHSMTYVRVPFEGNWRVRVFSNPDQFTELEAILEVPIGPG